MISSGVMCSISCGAPYRISWLARWIRLDVDRGASDSPRADGASAMRSTLPVAGACIGTETNPPGFAIGSPRTTSCPSRTIGMAGAPVCCESGTISMRSERQAADWKMAGVSLNSGTWTPREKLLPFNSPDQEP